MHGPSPTVQSGHALFDWRGDMIQMLPVRVQVVASRQTLEDCAQGSTLMALQSVMPHTCHASRVQDHPSSRFLDSQFANLPAWLGHARLQVEFPAPAL